MLETLSEIYNLELVAGACFLLLAFSQVFVLRRRNRIIHWLAAISFAVLAGGVSFGKYYAGTASTRLERVEKADPERANKTYSAAIKLAPGNPQLYFRRGLTSLATGQYGAALADLTKAIEIEPTVPDYLAARGILFAQLHDFESAKKDLDRAVALYAGKKTPDALTALAGISLWRPGGVNDAIASATQALAAKPNPSDRCDALAYRSRAYIFRQSPGDLDDASRDLMEAEKVCSGPMIAEVIFFEGDVYRLLHEPDKALDALAKVLKLSPNDWGAYYNRGLLLAEQGQYADAISDLGRAIELEPDDAALYRARAQVYAKMGDQDQSGNDLATANKLSDHGPIFDPPTVFHQHYGLPWEQLPRR